MRYSVWNPTTRAYDYYSAPGSPSIHAGAPPKRRTDGLGATVDQAAWRLPISSKKVGSGAIPQGRIASMGGDDVRPSSVPMWALAVIGFIVYEVIR